MARQIRRPRGRAASRSLARPTLWLIGFVGIAAVVVMFQIGFNAPNAIPGRQYYTIGAQFRDADNLTAHYQVRVSGRLVGQVLNPRAEDGKAVVDLQLDPDIGPLRSSTKLRVRPRSAIGVRFVELLPGKTGRLLEDGETILAKNTSTAGQLDTTLGTLDAKRRKKAQELFSELGGGTLGRGDDIAATLANAPSALNRLDRLSVAINSRPGAPQRFVREMDAALSAVSPVRDVVRDGFAPSNKALRPIADEAGSFADSLNAASPALRQARAGLADTEPLLTQLDGLSKATVPALKPAPEGLRATSRLLTRSGRGLRTARITLDKADSAVPDALELLRTADPILPAATTALTQGLPAVDRLGAHGCDIGLFFQNWGRALGFGVNGGDTGELGQYQQLRLQLTVNEEFLAGQTKRLPSVASNPYPKPCDVSNDNASRR